VASWSIADTFAASGFSTPKRRAIARDLLLVLPVPLMNDGRRICVEAQAANGLKHWKDNFGRVTVAAPLLPGTPPSGKYLQVRDVREISGVKFIPLPYAYHPAEFARHFVPTTQFLARLIEEHQYLHFAIGGLVGDWASVAAILAARKRRQFAIWTDRVESQIMHRSLFEGCAKRRLQAALFYLPLKYYERALLKRSTLALLHGADCYEAYASYCSNAHLVHNIHLKAADRITADAVEEKVARTAGKPSICYAGRADDEKGPFDWLRVVKRVRESVPDLEAVWMGDGPALDRMRVAARELGIDNAVTFAGFVDHKTVMQRIREASVFLFCHKSLESPRCLIEALMVGTPIVGYDSPFPADLILKHRGGVLTPKDDVETLSNALTGVLKQPFRHGDLIRRAARDGSAFSDEDVFRHRSELMKTYLVDVAQTDGHRVTAAPRYARKPAIGRV
jgi:glycosyltransferase involved in cell wall biosynthesis